MKIKFKEKLKFLSNLFLRTEFILFDDRNFLKIK